MLRRLGRTLQKCRVSDVLFSLQVYEIHIYYVTSALPLGTVGSVRPTFVPARRVGLAVKLPSAFALEGQSPSGPRKPLHASATFWEAYAP
ncbi:hypothetical protein OROMI_006402 [Orobanche minor]